jgi:hypothetical protein
MKIFCVRIGNKYGPEYEKYLEDRLPEYDIHWIREPFAPGIMLQWNKMLPMSLDIDEPVVVMDIDLLLINDYRKVFDYPVERGEFVASPDWWNLNHDRMGYTINGGFFKYYPQDCRYVYDKFMENPRKWQQHYINNGTTSGPVNGEQYFVEDTVKERLTIKTLPDAWFTRWATPKAVDHSRMWEPDRIDSYKQWVVWMNMEYTSETGNEFLYLDGEFHEDVKVVHFTHSVNKPHEWEDYELFK